MGSLSLVLAGALAALRKLGWLIVPVVACAACNGKTQFVDTSTTPLPNPTLRTVDKVDLLFMIDNSASMGDKQSLLALAVPDLIRRLVQPNCLDGRGNVVGRADDAGACAKGRVEFPPVRDMHVGIVTSSLGGRGSDQCDPNANSPVKGSSGQTLPSHNDDRGHLVNRGGADETPVAGALPSNFLSWAPGDDTPDAFVRDFTAMVTGIHEHGCGFEGQNEAWYRFLVQPDPYDSIEKNGTRAYLSGIDETILQQRHEFLRPDSLLAVIVVTDENEELADPIALGGQGWAYANTSFPGSPNSAAPKGTIECQSNPVDPNCTSCAFVSDPGASFGGRCPGGAYLDPSDDQLNVRFFHQKQRFGVFAGFPTSRYVTGLTKTKVPSAGDEHDKNGNYIGDSNAKCVNPIFAANLPTSASDELCDLQPGPRTPDLVYYAAIAGVPHQLLQQDRNDPDSALVDPTSLAPDESEAFWDRITGRDPERYDFSGQDFHMIESETARAGSNCPPDAGDTCDPWNGREWDTSEQDLQFACVFELPQPKDCNAPQYQGACDCATGSQSRDTPLCQKMPGDPNADQRGYTNLQVQGKAYPSVREMWIARQMGTQGIASSLCPIHVAEKAPADPLFGYRPAMNAIVDRLKRSLGSECLPQRLTADAAGGVACLMLVTLGQPTGGDEGACAALGYSVPDDRVLAQYRKEQEDAWRAAGSHRTDPARFAVCEMNQLTPATNPDDFDDAGSCVTSADPGWCYVEGKGAGGCSQAIVFSAQPPAGASVAIRCSW